MPGYHSILAAGAAFVLLAAPAHAAGDPKGIWFDHNGRGAVEIKDCDSGKGLCGFVVHVKDPKNSKRCGLQILGNVTKDGGGWIYSPERGSRYNVELSRLSGEKLRVVGNAGSRFFSRTFTWNRAPEDIARCDETEEASATDEKKEAANEEAADEQPAKRKTEMPMGNATGSIALIASAKTPTPATDPITDSDKKVTTVKTKKAKVASVQDDDEPTTKKNSDRKCTFRIPYVNRTVKVPCR